MSYGTGKVVNGKIVPAGGALPEGADVRYWVDDEEPFTVTPEEEAMLLDAIAQADRGECIDAEVVLNELRRKR